MLDLAWRFENDASRTATPGPVTAVSPQFRLDQRMHFASGGQDGTIRIWDLERRAAARLTI
jgi:WD40 repeat protein